MTRLWWVGVGLFLVAAPRPGEAQDTTRTDSLPPAGMGRLLQEDISVGIDDGTVQFRIMPLDESILRLLAPDSYRSTHALREARRTEILEAAERFGVTEPVAFFVTVFGMRDRAHFDPDRLAVFSRNRLFRPIAILPLTPLWNDHRVSQRETAGAIYVFEDGLALWEPLTIEYAGARSDAWSRSLRLIERERARISRRSDEPR